MINNHTIQFPFSASDLQLRVTYNASGDPEYIGRARPGALTNAAEWQICKISYDASRNVTAIQFAAGMNDYVNVWDDYDHYTYS